MKSKFRSRLPKAAQLWLRIGSIAVLGLAGGTAQANIIYSLGTDFATASFGGTLTAKAQIELVNDGTPVTADACDPLIGFTAGHIALISRGTCLFTVKVKNAQNAGAIGALVFNNATGAPLSLGGADPTILIPVLSLSKDLGNSLVTELAAFPLEPIVFEMNASVRAPSLARIEPETVPEPGSLALLGLGLAGLGALRRKRS